MISMAMLMLIVGFGVDDTKMMQGGLVVLGTVPLIVVLMMAASRAER
jgi:hypothetical protein